MRIPLAIDNSKFSEAATQALISPHRPQHGEVRILDVVEAIACAGAPLRPGPWLHMCVSRMNMSGKHDNWWIESRRHSEALDSKKIRSSPRTISEWRSSAPPKSGVPTGSSSDHMAARAWNTFHRKMFRRLWLAMPDVPPRSSDFLRSTEDAR